MYYDPLARQFILSFHFTLHNSSNKNVLNKNIYIYIKQYIKTNLENESFYNNEYDEQND